MNKFAYSLSSISLKYLSFLSKANIHIIGSENIPSGSNIFTANHFTRIETIFLPYHIHRITHRPVWSLAADELFQSGFLQALLSSMGAVSTRDPHRDDLILTTLLSKDAEWIIFPEGRMVKNKKTVKKNGFEISDGIEARPPHTGAAALALRCEFFRERLRRMQEKNPEECQRIANIFDITDIESVLSNETHIIPINISYYPETPKPNILSRIVQRVIKSPSQRLMDEIMTEGAMVFAGTDITIRFGDPIKIRPFLNHFLIESDLTTRRPIGFNEKTSSRPVIKEISIDIMETYMGRVYAMATINYDHVMACILKHFPYRADGIDLYEFKCKVYYAISEMIHNESFCYYQSFFDNQIHLLIDDRFGRFDAFFKIAQESGVITIEGQKIFKDQARFVRQEDFHRIRIENPLLVITNEIEPLKAVEAHLKKIAQIPNNEIHKLIKHHLLEKIQAEFDQDYDRYFREGESKKSDIGQPVFLQYHRDRAGVLLIHGYMAAPAEVKGFAQYLHARGYTVYAPRLKGHGTSPEDLSQTRYTQWIESVEEAYVVLKHSCETIFIGGFSTGAGLALELCTRVKDYKAVFAIAPPIQLRDLGSYFIPAIDTWNQMIKKVKLDAMAKEFIANQPENPHINYHRNPISGVHELEKLMDDLEPRLKQIEQPALVVQSRNDPVVEPKGTSRLFQHIGSAFKEYYIFDFDRHGILLGKGATRVYQAIENFLMLWTSGNKA
ncbi:MAG: alpha/beta fold hydrolase [Desulfobacteraceae bacterium]|nr:MAG: alpha/beta fold hydrolase [Desulfobacteraceae bacterium]